MKLENLLEVFNIDPSMLKPEELQEIIDAGEACNPIVDTNTFVYAKFVKDNL